MMPGTQFLAAVVQCPGCGELIDSAAPFKQLPKEDES